MSEHFDQLCDHLRPFAGSAQIRELRWPEGPILRSQPEFRVACIVPSQPKLPWIYASSGAWTRHTADGHLEYFIISPVDDVIHVETLAMVTNFALDAHYEVRLGTIMEIGRGWLPGSRCDHLLVSLPYPYGPKLEEIGPGKRLLWLLPITQEEAAFGREHGIEALEQCFEREKLDYLDPARDSVALEPPAPPRGGWSD